MLFGSQAWVVMVHRAFCGPILYRKPHTISELLVLLHVWLCARGLIMLSIEPTASLCMMNWATGSLRARGLSLATGLVVVIAEVWECQKALPGPMFPDMLALVKMPNQPASGGNVWFIHSTRHQKHPW